MGPDYLSSLFLKSDVPDQLRDNNKLIQPLKRTTTFGIKSLAYFGAHLWNLLPHHVKNSVPLCNFKSLIKKWSGPTCSCCVCTLVILLFASAHNDLCLILNHIQIITIFLVICVQCTAVLFCSLKMPIWHWIFYFKSLYIQNVYNGLFILIYIYIWNIYNCLFMSLFLFYSLLLKFLVCLYLAWMLYIFHILNTLVGD